MLHLISLEWKKLKTYRLFQVLSILYFVLFPLIYYAGQSINLPEEFEGGVMSFFIFPKIWGALGYLGSWLTFFFLGFLGVTMISMEVSNKTLRQGIINGMSRKEFFLGKILMMLVMSAAAAAYYALIGLVFGFIHTDYVIFSKVVENMDLIPRFFLQSFGFMSFAFMLAILIRRPGIPLFLYVTYSLIIETILRYAFHFNVIGKVDSINYYPLNVLEDLVPQPLPPQMLDSMDVPYNFFLTPTQAVLMSLGYIGLFLFISYRSLMRRDL